MTKKNIRKWKNQNEKKYRKNKYFWFFILIIIVNISFLVFVANHFFNSQEKEVDLSLKQKQIELQNLKKITNLQKLDSPKKQIGYLDSIKDGDVLKVDKTTIYFPKLNNAKATTEKFKRSSFVPVVDLNDRVSDNIFPYLVDKKINNIAITEPVFANQNELKLRWSDSDDKNANANEFIKNYLSMSNTTLTLNINSSKNNLWDLKIPELLRIKFLSLVMQKYNIHNINVNLESNANAKNTTLLNSMYLLQLYLNNKNYNVSFDFELPNVIDEQLSDQNKSIINAILKRGLNANTFVLDIDAGSKKYLNDRMRVITQNITDLKYKLKSSLKKYKDIDFNDATLNSFISVKIHPETNNVAYSVSDIKLITNLFRRYEFNKLFLHTINVDSGLSEFDKSLFVAYSYSNQFKDVDNDQEIQREDIFKVFDLDSTKVIINYLRFTKVDVNNLHDMLSYLPQQFYKKGDIVQYNGHIYKYISNYQYYGIEPDSGNEQIWQDKGSVDKLLKKQKDGNITVIKHNGKYYN